MARYRYLIAALAIVVALVAAGVGVWMSQRSLADRLEEQEELIDELESRLAEETGTTEPLMSPDGADGEEPTPEPAPSPTPAPAPEPGVAVGEVDGPAHTGETIGVMIVASETSRAAAEAKLADAQAALGEFETYFVLDRSDHYQGMTAGYWVVFEPYCSLASAQSAATNNAPWLNSRGINPYAKQVKVLCDDTFAITDEGS